jgi:proteasome lid subunit RPN8/RPN11
VTDARLITIPPEAADAMRRHAVEAYPYEACGAIFGTGDGAAEPWRVVSVEPAPNEHIDDQHRRYLVSPAYQAEAERRALAAGIDVIGWYHSHPDEPARPSEYDRSHAWVGYTYLVHSVRAGRAVDVNAFTLDAQDGMFVPVTLETATTASSAPTATPSTASPEA